jgi:hypothetical protein
MVSISKLWNAKFVMGSMDYLVAPLVCWHVFLPNSHEGIGFISLQQKVSMYANWFH